ncbi:aminopeptidase P family protein [Candidatus Bathyarchaeota archaeon]|nr:aminopeptidase P family protein [Candidatus Bathyarchaeota archaeon]
MERERIDVYIISQKSSIYYYSGTTGGTFLLVNLDFEPLLLAPKVDYTISLEQAKGCRVYPYKRDQILEIIESELKKINARVIGFDDLPIEVYKGLNERYKEGEFINTSKIIWEMRKIKDPQEEALMRRAGELASIGMNSIMESLREGVREFELAAEAVHSMMRAGAEGLAFPISIASGPRSVYPHAGVTDREIKRGDFVTVDLGASYKEYKSDLTRTFIVGRPTKEKAEIYETVLKAKEAAMMEFKEGAKGRDLDKTARDIIDKEGSSEYFVHSLGHGVGLDIHEPPSLSEISEDTLTSGNIVTCEPGIYIPGKGGVRIEDTVLVGRGGAERLTRFVESLDEVCI